MECSAGVDSSNLFPAPSKSLLDLPTGASCWPLPFSVRICLPDKSCRPPIRDVHTPLRPRSLVWLYKQHLGERKKKENLTIEATHDSLSPRKCKKACSVPACRWQQVCGAHPSAQREAEGQAKRRSHQLQLLQMLSPGFISLHRRWLHVQMHLKYGWFTTFLLIETCLFSKTGNTEALQPKPVVF